MQNLRVQLEKILSDSDEGLAFRIKRGDHVALNELFRRYFSKLCRFAYGLVNSKEDVQDIVVGVFEKTWTNRDTLDKIGSVRAYLFKAAKNRAYDYLKNRGRDFVRTENLELHVVSSTDPVEDMLSRDLISAMNGAIEKLPTRCKLIFTMNRQDGLSYREIADILNISERTVENQLAFAFKRLRVLLKDFKD